MFDPTAADPELLEWADQTLRTEIAAAAKRLEAAGVDLMSPLQAAKSEDVDLEDLQPLERPDRDETESGGTEAFA